jgi:hypothetical protein
MKYIFLFFFLNSLKLVSQSEIMYNGEKINLLDTNNQKQGVWKLFDEENQLMITCELKNDTLISDINYYKDSTLIISYIYKSNYFILYKGLDTIQAKLMKTPDNKTSLVKRNGEEIDTTISNWFYKNEEVNSMYYGGYSELNKFISKTINNNNTDKHKGIVKIKFGIDAYGFVRDIELVKGEDDKLIKEAFRIINEMPRWQPGHQRGIFVSTSYIIPISFK